MSVSEADVARWKEDGVLHPVPLLSQDEAAGVLARVRREDFAGSGRMPGIFNLKAHLASAALWDVVHDKRMIELATALLGPDVACWGSNLIWKPNDGEAFFPWHQDAPYWWLDAYEGLTVWLALTPTTVENGCMRVQRGSHHSELTHDNGVVQNSMLPLGESLREAPDEASIENVLLQPGEASVHHVMTVHGSQPNRTDAPRIGFTVRLIPAHLRQREGIEGSATHLAGRDHGNFAPEVAPVPGDKAATMKNLVGPLRVANQIVHHARAQHVSAA